MRVVTPIGLILTFLVTGCWPRSAESAFEWEEVSIWASQWLQEEGLRLHANEFNGAAAQPILTWDMRPGQNHHVALARDPSCKDLVWDVNHVESPVIIKDVPDGLYYGCAWACKAASRECGGAENQGVRLVIDRTAPQLDAPIQDVRTFKPFSLDLWVRDVSYVTFFWEVLDGPGAVIISDQVASKPMISMTEPGTYTMQLTLTDDFMNQSSLSFKVEWTGSNKHASR